MVRNCPRCPTLIHALAHRWLVAARACSFAVETAFAGSIADCIMDKFVTKLPRGAQLPTASSTLAVSFNANRSGECEMTPGEQPLVCSCGAHSAKHISAKKKQPARWMVMAVKAPGQKPQAVTTVIAKEKALQRVQAICAGSKTPADPTATRAATHPTTDTQRNLRERTAVNYDDTVRNASCCAGPGRGHKRQPETALGEAEAVLKKPKATTEELRGVLGKLCSEHRLLQQWYQRVQCHIDLDSL